MLNELLLIRQRSERYEADFSFALLQEKIDFSKVKLPESIEEFFSKEEFEQMCDLDRLHFKNIRLNYEMMLYFG